MHRMPLFFKLWFAFVASMALSAMGFAVWTIYSVISAGPEGIGAAVGTFLRAASQQ